MNINMVNVSIIGIYLFEYYLIFFFFGLGDLRVK